ncbi:MAG TPA: lipid-A-disaccharide synthase [Smithellaceae bacterium]|nr:lipid-A-disaccharide synthase [Smithellaceae bacterium]
MSPEAAKKIMIIAGEASGDMHGASLVREMHKLDSSLAFFGIGGNRLEEAGVKLLAHASEIAVVGLTEVIAKISSIRKIAKNLKRAMDELRPELLILIDFPDFNLNIAARAAKKRNIRIFYYISPQVWAWRKSRINQIKKLVDKMAVILPFEVATYAQKGFAVDYVGHPLLDMVKMDYSRDHALNQLNLPADKTTVALLPGSRMSEVNKLLPEMIKAADIMRSARPEIQFILPLADMLEEKIITDMIDGYRVPVKVINGRTYDVITCADLAIVASGTATLETGLLGVPMVIVYKMSPISYFVGRLIVDVKNIGLVNIVAGKTIVPELIQDEANAGRIAAEALDIINDPEKQKRIKSELQSLRAKMGNPGAALRAAKLAVDML